jgi:cation diffusion facilitator family transporter
VASPVIATLSDGRETSRQKVRVAKISAVAALALVAAKAVVGWQTGSLGILSEAAHSTLDLIATLITLFAVRVADRPADQDHHYGHGKIENLSALVEVALLLATCVWIIHEAIERLLGKPADVDASWIAFGVMLTSIVVDISRSRALAKTAKATNSQALEADALHFRVDVWSSCTVLGGLAAVWAGRRWGIPSFFLADAAAAILVAVIVLTVGAQLGKRAVDALLDRAPLDVVDRIRAAVRSVPSVQGPVTLRARRVGAHLFVDAAISIGRDTSFEGAHAVVDRVEQRIREVVPNASILIHAEPRRVENESLGEVIRHIVSRHATGAHDIFIRDAEGKPGVDLHFEVPGDLSLAEAHALTERIETDLRREAPAVGPVHIHVDPVRPVRETSGRTEDDIARVVARVQGLAMETPGILDCHKVSVREVEGRIWVTCHCTMDSSLAIRVAHEIGLELERRARREIPAVERFTVHAEPARPQTTGH